MKKKQIILEVIGKVVEKHGFAYGLCKANSGSGIWGFTRSVDGIEQMVFVQEHRFAKALFLEFRTTAWGSKLSRAGKGLDIPNVYSNTIDQWNYENDDDFRGVLLEFADIIEKYGIDELNKMSLEENVIPTKPMADKLLTSYESLSGKFAKQHQIDLECLSKKSVSKWFEIIEKNISQTKNDPYEKVQDMIVEIAAFLGEQLRKEMGGEWKRGTDPRHVYLEGLNGFLLTFFFALGDVITAWKKQNTGYLTEYYSLILDNKLPLTESQMMEIQDRHRLMQSGMVIDGSGRWY